MNPKENLKNYFKLHGFLLEPKAVTYVTEVISNFDSAKCTKVVDKMISTFMDLGLPNNRISVEILKQTINACRKDTNSLKLFQVIDAYHTPKLVFDCNSKKYIIDEISSAKPFFQQLFSDSSEIKFKVLRSRYQIIYQRLMRDKSFNYHNSLKPITNVLTTGSAIRNVIILGMLSQFHEGRWFLEDETGYVEINLDNAEYHKGLIIEGSFVLAEGKYEEKMLYVDTIGMPIVEPAAASRLAICDNINYFGGLPVKGGVKSCKHINNLVQTELGDKALVFLSDIFLDQEIVIQKLKILFQGYKIFKPEAFILCGDFLSASTIGMDISDKLKLLKEGIRNVVKSFAMFPDLALVSNLIFVPGPSDLFQGISSVLPHPSLSSSYLLDGIFNSQSNIDSLKDRIIFTSNPCRMTFYDKEIVIFRESIMQKLYRHCMYIPNEKDQLEEISQLKDSLDDSIRNTTIDNSELDPEVAGKKNSYFLEKNLIWTILSQAHLLPLPIHISPVYWQFDNALQLFPLPDLLVLSDSDSSSFNIQLSGCNVLNPFNFSTEGDFPFNIYYPFTGQVQNCNVNVDM